MRRPVAAHLLDVSVLPVNLQRSAGFPRELTGVKDGLRPGDESGQRPWFGGTGENPMAVRVIEMVNAHKR